MKVLIITGSYPPDKCGVGDYTDHLANALVSRKNIEVNVLTGVESAALVDEDSQVRVLYKVSNWRNRNLLDVWRVVKEIHPDVVHIQYPTQGYAGRRLGYSHYF